MEILPLLLRFGAPGQDEPLLAGTFIFGFVALVLTYFVVFREEMDTTRVTKGLIVVLFGLAVLALVWPQRPWPH